jgi:hypothetical protein
VFTINTNGSGFTTLHRFSGVSGPTPYPSYGTNSDGGSPHGNLILSGNTLYVTANADGSADAGTVFSLTLPEPQLTITPSGGIVILTWPTNSGVFTLRCVTNLDSPIV